MRENVDNVMARIDQIYRRISEIQSLGRQGALRRAQQTEAAQQAEAGRSSAAAPGRGAAKGEAFADALEQAMLSEALKETGTFGEPGAGRGGEAGGGGVRLQGPGAAGGYPARAGSGAAGGAASFESLVQVASQFFGVDSGLIKAVIRQESEFDPAAVSSKGAVGLMQLMPETAELLGVDDPLNPAKNIYGGTKYLKQMLDRYDGNLEFALAAYNAGPSTVDEAGGIPDIAETKNYVEKVLGYFKQYRGGEGGE